MEFLIFLSIFLMGVYTLIIWYDLIDYLPLYSKEDKEFAHAIIQSMEETPEKWKIDSFYASTDKIKIRIANKPYSDCKINEERLVCRHELRKAITKFKINQLKNN